MAFAHQLTIEKDPALNKSFSIAVHESDCLELTNVFKCIESDLENKI